MVRIADLKTAHFSENTFLQHFLPLARKNDLGILKNQAERGL